MFYKKQTGDEQLQRKVLKTVKFPNLQMLCINMNTALHQSLVITVSDRIIAFTALHKKCQ